jgi:hypothetical protein
LYFLAASHFLYSSHITTQGELTMAKTNYTPLENSANQQNANKGTSGFNSAYKAAMDNHANQLNPNNSLYGRNKPGKK